MILLDKSECFTDERIYEVSEDMIVSVLQFYEADEIWILTKDFFNIILFTKFKRFNGLRKVKDVSISKILMTISSSKHDVLDLREKSKKIKA